MATEERGVSCIGHMTTLMMTTDRDQSHVMEKIFNLTLKIISLLTGEGYTVVKKTTCECVTFNRRDQIGTQEHIIDPSAVSLSPLCDQKMKNILNVTQRISQLMTGEVPIRCQDVAVYFSMEEWEYLEGQKDLYKDVMMEDEPDGSRKRNPPQRCPRLLDSTQEELTIPHHDQDEFIKVEVKQEEETVNGARQSMEEYLEGQKDLYKDVTFEEQRNSKSETFRKNTFCLNELILDHTLEIIYLLTGEDCVVVMKTCSEENAKRRSSRLRARTIARQTPITVPPFTMPSLDRQTRKKILHVNNEIIELLAEEVPIRCEDVTVYFSMEEWEYLQGHKDLYKDVMMEDQPDGSRKRNPPQICPRPLDSTQEELALPHQDQSEKLKDSKVEVKGKEKEMSSEVQQSTDEGEMIVETKLMESSLLMVRRKKKTAAICDIFPQGPCSPPPQFDMCKVTSVKDLVPTFTVYESLLKLPESLMDLNKKRVAYTARFKLMVVKYAKQHGNRAAARHFGELPRESTIREWRRNEEKIKTLSKTKCNFRSGIVKWPKLEEKVKEFVLDQRKAGVALPAKNIIFQAVKISKELQIDDFKGTTSWCQRFLRRHKLWMPARTRTAQRRPKDDYEEKTEQFQKFIMKQKKRQHFEMSQIGNMDEVPLTFHVPSTTTTVQGAETTTGHEKKRYTVVLACTADGHKLPPFVIWKSKTIPKETIPSGVHVHVHPKGWMDEEGMKLWVRDVWGKRPGGFLKKPSILVVDSFRSYLTERTKKELQQYQTDIAVIPGALTSQLQPFDVSIKKPFKSFMREEWNKYECVNQRQSAGAGQTPSISKVCEWIKTSWDAVKEETVIECFKKRGINQASDGDETLNGVSSSESESTSLLFDSEDTGSSEDKEFCGLQDSSASTKVAK